MPCSYCGATQVYLDKNLTCPSCTRLNLLEFDEALKVANKWIEFARESWRNVLRPFNRDLLICGVAWEREKYCRLLLNSAYSSIKLGFFFDTSFIIKGAMVHSQSKNLKPFHPNDLKEILDVADKLNLIENEYSKIMSGYSNIILKEPLLGGKMTTEELSKLIIAENEKYDHIRKAFADQDIFTDEEGKRKEQEILSSIEPKPKVYRSFTSEEFISACYPIMLSFYGGLLRNSFYAKIFDLRHFKEVFNDPSELMIFVNKFPQNYDDLTYIPLDKFIEKAQIVLKLSKHKIMKYLLFSPNNLNTFPLFVVVQMNSRKFVIVSRMFAYQIYVMLHVIITKSLFDAETEKLSKKFEKDEVKKEFEKLGYSYIVNVTDNPSSPTLEIDGIAVKDRRCFVIECKAWRFPHLAEESTKNAQIVRDLQGIVDGIKYTFTEQKTTHKNVKSLLDKVEFIRNNLAKLGIDGNSVRNVKGLIVTLIHPPICEYKGVGIRSVKEVSNI